VHGGTATLFNTPYKNMLDLYHPVNRMLAALLPSTVASIIPQFPTIIEIFTIHIIRRILERDLATVHAGGTVERAGIRVTRDGLILSGQTSVTPLGGHPPDRSDAKQRAHPTECRRPNDHPPGHGVVRPLGPQPAAQPAPGSGFFLLGLSCQPSWAA
jgi:hypothetical protein